MQLATSVATSGHHHVVSNDCISLLQIITMPRNEIAMHKHHKCRQLHRESLSTHAQTCILQNLLSHVTDTVRWASHQLLAAKHRKEATYTLERLIAQGMLYPHERSGSIHQRRNPSHGSTVSERIWTDHLVQGEWFRRRWSETCVDSVRADAPS